MKFLVDMPISPKTVTYLQSLGHDAVHLYHLGESRATDEEIVKIAKEQNRIILSTDLDFGSILAHSKDIMPGVILFRIEYATVEKINLILSNLFYTIKPETINNSIIVIDDFRIRIRKLPIL